MNKIAKCPCGYPLDEKGLCICCIEEKLLEDCEWYQSPASNYMELPLDDYDYLLHKAREAIRLARENAELKQQLINKKEECRFCGGYVNEIIR